MPFASAELLVEAARILVQEDVDLVVPRTIEGLEPLHAVYRRDTCLPVVRSAVESNQLKVIDWFPLVRVREQTLEEVTRIDPSGLTFWNLNTLEEFNQAENQSRNLK
jgi:Molybdopterin-guanine dinucleotide biosynthesis protein A